MPKYLSGRQKRRPQDQLSDDRYQYLGLDQAEPNLSDPLVGPNPPSGLLADLKIVVNPAVLDFCQVPEVKPPSKVI